MNRSALALYFRRLVLASLPLASLGAVGCGPGFGGCSGTHDEVIAQAFDDAGVVGDGGDTDGGTPAGCEAACEHQFSFAFRARFGATCGPATQSDGAPGYVCHVPNNCTGRRPAGLVDVAPPGSEGASEVARYFARAAALEAASVGAFRTLAHELAAHGAPASLVEEARRAARDEVRHTRAMAGLARRHGLAVSEAVDAKAGAASTAVRPLAALAVENAVEGCVRECWGALVAAWQAEAATDEAVRRVHRAIARDEARHAELGFAVDAWAQGRLSGPERDEVAAARAAAMRQLTDEATHGAPPELVAEAGLPSPAAAAQLLAGIARGPWAA